MSLFPAYSISQPENVKEPPEENEKTNDNSEWLTNSSFQPIASNFATLNNIESSESSSDNSNEDVNDDPDKLFKNEDSTNSKTSVKLKKHKKKKSKKESSIGETCANKHDDKINNLFFQDSFRNTMFCTIDTINNMRPKYKRSNQFKLGFIAYNQFKKKKCSRYYLKNLDSYHNKLHEKEDEKNSKDKDFLNSDEYMDSLKDKEVDEQKLKTEEFNRKLSENPKDVTMWLDYSAYQDEVSKESKLISKQGALKRLTTQKKLSIIEKGLSKNPTSLDLLKMKLHLMIQIYPTDQFASEVESLIKKDPKNIVLWRALIMSIKSSCSLCTVTKILELYTKCFQVLRKSSKADPKLFDRQILKLWYQLVTFLRHAGLWEQMWEIIRMNLCLNLDLDNDTLLDIKSVEEKALINMEELVLTSRLPLNQLWLRIESLRESCHWTSVNSEKVDLDLIGDAKRLVSSEDVSEFIYPMITQNSKFYLSILSLMALKVPLIPTRHCLLQDLNLEDVWSTETLEYCLPMIYIIDTELNTYKQNSNFVSELIQGKLTSGPQFLKFHPAQETFLDFIRSVFSTVSNGLNNLQKTSILIWWLKFEKMLVYLVKFDPLFDKSRNKKLKSIIKEFLKKTENRNNMYFYKEYALIELELGNFQTCIQILETIIQSQNKNSLNKEDKIALINLYKTYLKILLTHKAIDSNDNNVHNMMNKFQNFLSNASNKTNSINEILFNEINVFLESPVCDETEEEIFLPNLYCDILSCYTFVQYIKYLKYKNENFLSEILILFDKCLKHCNDYPRLKERFCEEKIMFLQFYKKKIQNVSHIIINSLDGILAEFPDNFYFLSIKAISEIELPFYKLSLKNEKYKVWSALSICLAGRSRISYLNFTGLEDSSKAMLNKLLSFHRALTKIFDIQSCPLIWRLYMLLLDEHELSKKKGEEVYYEAVAECPWVRSIYISAAEIAPQILSQIQDLLKEKELRIHVTPEELEILREY